VISRSQAGPASPRVSVTAPCSRATATRSRSAQSGSSRRSTNVSAFGGRRASHGLGELLPRARAEHDVLQEAAGAALGVAGRDLVLHRGELRLDRGLGDEREPRRLVGHDATHELGRRPARPRAMSAP